MPKAPAQTYIVDAKPDKESRWTRVGRDHYAQSIVEATFTPVGPRRQPDMNLPSVSMLVALDEVKTPQVLDIKINAGDQPLTPESIRIPLRAMARAAIACQSYRLEGNAARLVAMPGDTFIIGKTLEVEHYEQQRLHELEREVRANAKRARKPRITDDELQRVARLYVEAPYGQRIETIVRELKLGTAGRHAAKSRIAKARARGYIK